MHRLSEWCRALPSHHPRLQRLVTYQPMDSVTEAEIRDRVARIERLRATQKHQPQATTPRSDRLRRSQEHHERVWQEKTARDRNEWLQEFRQRGWLRWAATVRHRLELLRLPVRLTRADIAETTHFLRTLSRARLTYAEACSVSSSGRGGGFAAG